MKRDLSKMTCIEDLRRVAQRKVPRMFYDYADSGSWTESTYRANSSDFQDIKFRQRVLVDMEGRSLATKMIGEEVKMPLAIAPEYVASGGSYRPGWMSDDGLRIYNFQDATVPVQRRDAEQAEAYDIVGPVCESGDWLARGRPLALAEGDLLAIASAGAYGMAMASNYNTRPRAAEVIVDGNDAHLVRERESIESLFALERRLPR